MSFGSRRVLRGLDLEVLRGELLVLFGGSGSGKSTFLRSIIGLDPISQGSILFKNQELTELSIADWKFFRQKIAYAFQNGALFDSLSVLENLEYPLRELTAQSADLRRESAAQMLMKIGLPGIESMFPAELSGGMQKRVGMARSLMLDPEIILYDEPTAGLDPANAKKIIEMMRDLRESGKTAILVTHDVHYALAVADRVAYIESGKIIAVQSRVEIDQNPHSSIRAYMQGDIA